MKLSEILLNVTPIEIVGSVDVDVTNINIDSRQVQPEGARSGNVAANVLVAEGEVARLGRELLLDRVAQHVVMGSDNLSAALAHT